jgi:hypothetical protein
VAISAGGWTLSKASAACCSRPGSCSGVAAPSWLPSSLNEAAWLQNWATAGSLLVLGAGAELLVPLGDDGEADEDDALELVSALVDSAASSLPDPPPLHEVSRTAAVAATSTGRDRDSRERMRRG